MVELKPIGVIHSPYTKAEEIPCQGYKSKKIGEVEVFPEYADGLKDLDGFSHIILLYVFHESKNYSLSVRPFLDKTLRGVFATRAPWRPNSIGMSTVKLLEIKGNKLKVQGIDVLDGTPLVDIKPYVPVFDERKNAKIGWLEGKV